MHVWAAGVVALVGLLMTLTLRELVTVVGLALLLCVAPVYGAVALLGRSSWRLVVPVYESLHSGWVPPDVIAAWEVAPERWSAWIDRSRRDLRRQLASEAARNLTPFGIIVGVLLWSVGIREPLHLMAGPTVVLVILVVWEGVARWRIHVALERLRAATPLVAIARGGLYVGDRGAHIRVGNAPSLHSGVPAGALLLRAALVHDDVRCLAMRIGYGRGRRCTLTVPAPDDTAEAERLTYRLLTMGVGH
jgi:hypothetical protein